MGWRRAGRLITGSVVAGWITRPANDGRAAGELDQPPRPGRHEIALSVGGATGEGQLRLAAQWVTGCTAHVVAGALTVSACRR